MRHLEPGSELIFITPRDFLKATAARRLTILLSDCRTTAGGDPLADARGLDELAILAPEGDSDDAEALAAAVGARWAPVGGPTSVVDALAVALSP